MPTERTWRRVIAGAIVGISLAAAMLPVPEVGAADPADFSHFEAKVRPLLVAHCLQCHAGEKTSGGLALDSREGWQKGGDSGPAIVPGEFEASLLLKAIRSVEGANRCRGSPPMRSACSWNGSGRARPTRALSG